MPEWSAEEVTELRVLTFKRWTAREIAAKLGRPVKSVTRKKEREGIHSKAPGAPRRPFTAREIELIEQGVAAGATDRGIAGPLGRSASSVKKKRHRLEIYKTKRRNELSPQDEEA